MEEKKTPWPLAAFQNLCNKLSVTAFSPLALLKYLIQSVVNLSSLTALATACIVLCVVSWRGDSKFSLYYPPSQSLSSLPWSTNVRPPPSPTEGGGGGAGGVRQTQVAVQEKDSIFDYFFKELIWFLFGYNINILMFWIVEFWCSLWIGGGGVGERKVTR